MNYISNVNKIKAFRFWCQKVLPTVYDDCLSYYEVLCKVRDKLDETILAVNTLIDGVTALDNLMKYFVELVEALNLEELNRMSAEIEQLRSDLDGLTSDFNGLATRVETNETNISNINTTLETVTTDINSIKSSLQNVENSINSITTDVTELLERMTVAESTIDTISNSLNGLSNRVSTLETNYNGLSSNVDTNTSDIASLKTRVTTNETNITNLQGRVSTLETNYNDLNSDVGTNTSDIASLKTRVSTNETAITNLNSRVSTNETNISSLLSRVTTNENNINELYDLLNKEHLNFAEIFDINPTLTESNITFNNLISTMANNSVFFDRLTYNNTNLAPYLPYTNTVVTANNFGGNLIVLKNTNTSYIILFVRDNGDVLRVANTLPAYIGKMSWRLLNVDVHNDFIESGTTLKELIGYSTISATTTIYLKNVNSTTFTNIAADLPPLADGNVKITLEKIGGTTHNMLYFREYYEATNSVQTYVRSGSLDYSQGSSVINWSSWYQVGLTAI